MMKTRACGDSGFRLPILGIGCWSFGGGEYWGGQSDRDVTEIVSTAIELGCNYFDTAEVYNDGRSEEALGRALRGRRSDAIIGTKVSPHNTGPDVLRNHCELSLRRLGTDYIDLYMVHWPINPVSLKHYTQCDVSPDNLPNTATAFETLRALKDEGKILHIGVSNFGPDQLREIEPSEITANELCYNLLCRAIEEEIYPLCHEMKIGIIGYMPLMQGILTGKYVSIDDIPWQRTRSRHFSGKREGSRHGEDGHEPLLEKALQNLSVISAETDIPLMKLALAWSMQNTGVACTVNGVRDCRQLMENYRATNLILGRDLTESLNSATEELKNAMGPYPDIYEAIGNTRIY